MEKNILFNELTEEDVMSVDGGNKVVDFIIKWAPIVMPPLMPPVIL